MKRMIAAALMILLLLSVTACDKAPSKESTPLNAESKAATEITAQTNAEVYQLLDFDDEQEAEFAGRGLIFAPDSLVIQAENGMTIWSQDAYDFVRESGDAPTSANPSLWRNTPVTACLRSRTASIRCAAMIFRTSPSSAVKTAGSSWIAAAAAILRPRH
mgnify:CR=1 FL=1